MMRRITLLTAALGLLISLGCGGSGERGKNKDLDRPGPISTRLQ